jgi:hypothetical protein
MQYLMVMLVMAGVIVLMIAFVVGISYALGAYLNAREAVPAGPAGADPCALCQAARDWYEDLPIWKRNVVTAWWLANRYQCAVKGCK